MADDAGDVKRLVLADDIDGSQIEKYVDRVEWWMHTANVGVDAVELEFDAAKAGEPARVPKFHSAVIAFSSEPQANHFDHVMGNFGVRTRLAG